MTTSPSLAALVGRDDQPAERWEIEADAAYARGVDAGLRAWHGNWPPDAVRSLMARNERLKADVVAARIARRKALTQETR